MPAIIADMDTAREEAELLGVLKTIHRPSRKMLPGEIGAKYHAINDEYWALRAPPTPQAISTVYWKSREEGMSHRQ